MSIGTKTIAKHAIDVPPSTYLILAPADRQAASFQLLQPHRPPGLINKSTTFDAQLQINLHSFKHDTQGECQMGNLPSSIERRRYLIMSETVASL